MKKTQVVIASALILCAAPALAAVANIVTNGTFEASNTTGWTDTCAGATGINSTALGANDLVINSGSVYATLNTQGQAATTCQFYQDFVIPATATAASLQFDYALTGSNPNDAADTRQIDVTTTAGASLVPIHADVNRTATRAFAPLGTPVNLLPYAGQTVRLRLQASHSSGSGSANIIGIDNVVLNVTTPDPVPVPTLTEWAMILFGATLAGLAGLTVLRRRRLTA